MQWQTVTDGARPDIVLATYKNSATATLTATAATIAKGEGVILATGTASANGVFVQRMVTATDASNNLYVGNAHDFPGTATNKTWQAEDVGLVQTYGLDTDAVIQLLTTAQTPGGLLIPNSIRALVASGTPTTTLAATAAAGVNGLAGLAVLASAVASSSATGTGTAYVFIRAM